MRPEPHVVVIGAGVGGLVAALALSARGVAVTVLEKGARPGGKMRTQEVGGLAFDGGPTVFTMRGVFEEIFAAAGERLTDHVELTPLETLARHAWSADERLDLFADTRRSADAIGAFAGAAEAKRFRDFCDDAKRIYEALERPFIRATRPSLIGLVRDSGWSGAARLSRIKPFTTMWRALGSHFHETRLRQLFGRYATYCGSSPFWSPATLMLVAHVESEGVWSVAGGMRRLADALAGVAAKHGAMIRYDADVSAIVTAAGRVTGVTLADGERVAAHAVIAAGDVSALAAGLFGDAATHAAAAVRPSQRSLSAMTWMLAARTEGFPLLRHNVFFSRDYKAEFDDIFAHGAMSRAPTIYVCAQDRGDQNRGDHADAERLLVLINAPPVGDTRTFDAAEIEQCTQRTFGAMERCGLTVTRSAEMTRVTTPLDFARLYPATGGALYGRSSHGWMASFRRPGARSKVPGLYLAGGSVHPGPGVPMAALSGQMAAQSVMTDLMMDLGSTGPSRAMAMRGGMSTRSRMTAATGSR